MRSVTLHCVRSHYMATIFSHTVPTPSLYKFTLCGRPLYTIALGNHCIRSLHVITPFLYITLDGHPMRSL